MSSTRISWHNNAPRAVVYHTLLDARAVVKWKVPDGMTCHVHAFDPPEGRSLRISLTYDAPTETGKTSAHTDTYHGRFVKLVPNDEIVEVDEFETQDPAFRGEMTITITLADANGGTELLAVHDGLPPPASITRPAGEWRSQSSLDSLRRVRHAGATPHALSSPPRKALLPRKRYSIYAIIETIGRRLISGLIFSAARGQVSLAVD